MLNPLSDRFKHVESDVKPDSEDRCWYVPASGNGESEEGDGNSAGDELNGDRASGRSVNANIISCCNGGKRPEKCCEEVALACVEGTIIDHGSQETGSNA